MSQVSISEAAKLVGRDRKTLYKDIKSGRLSATLSETGSRQVDTVELIRVYGELRNPTDSRATVVDPQKTTEELRVRLAAAEAELSQMRERLTEKDSHIADLRGAVRLLAAPKPAEPSGPWWKLW